MLSRSTTLLQLVAIFSFIVHLHHFCPVHGFSQKKDSLASPDSPTISRRDYWKVSAGVAGAVVYGKLVGDTISRIAQGIARPLAHEQRVEDAISLALGESAASFKSDRPFRILEVGIGSDCRLVRRGLYNKGLEQLESNSLSRVQLTGVDLAKPPDDIVQKARTVLSEQTGDRPMRVELDTMSEDIANGLAFPAGYFDSVICCLTLCSVTDQDGALQEMKRLVRPNGGTFAYVEHVAVNPDEPYRFLEWQQEILDPLQQRLADNCHLHRYTDDFIARIFHTQDDQGTRYELGA